MFKNLISKIRNDSGRAPSSLTVALSLAAVLWGLQTLNEAVLDHTRRLDNLNEEIRIREAHLATLAPNEVIEPEPARVES